jgi:outer membrane protein OmpA-like peptidoglycan-associated protein
MRSAAVLSFLLAIALAAPAQAQWGSFLDKAQQKAKEAVDAANKPPPAPPPAPKAAPGDSDEPAPKAKASASRGGDADATESDGGAPPPGEVYGNEYDFIAGERLIFFDDFSTTDVGDFPMKWTTKGGGGAPTEVVEQSGKHWLKLRAEKSDAQGSLQFIRLDVKEDLPQKFTIEFDCYTTGEYRLKMGQVSHHGSEIYIGPEEIKLPHTTIKRDAPPNRVQHVAISVSGSYAKVYVDGRRLGQDPEAFQRPINYVGFEFYSYYLYTKPRAFDMMTNFRIAEGGKDYGTELTTAGRIVTHGITFDVGSDVIRPESGPTLRKILKLLQENDALKFEIQGHTDSQGGDKVNIPLSEKRAQSVKAWLAAQGIDAGRLTTKGFGATKPLKQNDTPEGRAENRRVEFVKTSK